MGMACSTYAYKILIPQPEGKKQLGCSRLKWENDIKIDITRI
jgi:hypothetical protein